MKPLALLVVLVLSACQNPMLGADLRFGAGGVSANPTLSGEIAGATVTVEP